VEVLHRTKFSSYGEEIRQDRCRIGQRDISPFQSKPEKIEHLIIKSSAKSHIGNDICLVQGPLVNRWSIGDVVEDVAKDV
jgi:hypothetical protein